MGEVSSRRSSAENLYGGPNFPRIRLACWCDRTGVTLVDLILMVSLCDYYNFGSHVLFSQFYHSFRIFYFHQITPNYSRSSDTILCGIRTLSFSNLKQQDGVIKKLNVESEKVFPHLLILFSLFKHFESLQHNELCYRPALQS
jgi:hypothetical protein